MSKTNNTYHEFYTENGLRVIPIDDYPIDYVLKMVSDGGFLPSSSHPSENTLASVVDYQQRTNNYGFSKAIGMYCDEVLSGIMFLPVFKTRYNNTSYYCVQTAAIYIYPQYRGVFKTMVQCLLANYRQTLKLFMFSAPQVHKTGEKFGFFEVCQHVFAYNRYRILAPFSFISSSINTPILKKLVGLFCIFDGLFTPPLYRDETEVFENPHFDGDYTAIEKDYYITYGEKLVPEWNREVLLAKYGAACHSMSKQCSYNSTFHIVACRQNIICGSMVLKAIPGFRRLVIVEWHATENKRNQTLKAMLCFVTRKAATLKYEALMFKGLGADYEGILNRGFVMKKKSPHRVFVSNDIEALNKLSQHDYTFFYSSDDINF